MRSFSKLLILLPAVLATLVDGQPCCMCNGCLPSSERANVVLDSSGTTCSSYIVQLASLYQAGQSECSAMSQIHYDRCCTDGSFTPVTNVMPNNPCEHVPRLNNPPCDLCKGGGYPSKPSTKTSVMGLSGNPTCHNLFCMARKGHVSADLCLPMQDFMDLPCGCFSKDSQSAMIATSPQNPQLVPIVENPQIPYTTGTLFTPPN